MLSIFLRRSLVRSLFCTERLYLVYMKTSYFSLVPLRGFIDLLWITVETGALPTKKDVNSIKRYLKSKVVPDEEECIGDDFYGLYFISAVQMLCDFLESGDVFFLECIYGELEVNLMDQRIFEVCAGGEYSSSSPSVEGVIVNHPGMVDLLKQLSEDKRVSEDIDFVRVEIDLAKKKSIREIVV